jgi:vacuolar-type H+-ATPase subunit I/STV1
LPSGEDNPKYIDLLDEDKAIAGQKFVCVSFVSPDKILKKKNTFLFEEFLKHWDYNTNVKKFTQFLNFFTQKYNINFDAAMGDFQEFVKSEQSTLVETTIGDDFKNFLDAKEDELVIKFNEANSFQTSTRGLKIRGSFPSQEEAELRCKMLREVDPNHDVYVGPVGMWMPWEPEAYKTGRVEYLEEELNQLMYEKNKNEIQARQAFDKRVVDSKKTAIAENIKLANESGNKLTQNIDADGNLVGVGVSTVEKSIEATAANSADIRKELFEGENIRTRDTDKRDKEAIDNITIEEKKED